MASGSATARNAGGTDGMAKAPSLCTVYRTTSDQQRTALIRTGENKQRSFSIREEALWTTELEPCKNVKNDSCKDCSCMYLFIYSKYLYSRCVFESRCLHFSSNMPSGKKAVQSLCQPFTTRNTVRMAKISRTAFCKTSWGGSL